MIVLCLTVYWCLCIIWGTTSIRQWLRVNWDQLEFPNKHEERIFLAFQQSDMKKFQKINFKNMTRWIIGVTVLLPVRFIIILCIAIMQLTTVILVQMIYPPPLDVHQYSYNATAQKLLCTLSRILVRSGSFVWGITRINEYPINGRTSVPQREDLHSIVISNHVSGFDILYFMQKVFPSFVAKFSVLQTPIIGRCASAMRCIFVNRESIIDREQALKNINQRSDALSIMSKNNRRFEDVNKVPPLVIFPEGTTTSGYALLPFKRGAFEGLKPVTPVVLVYCYTHINTSLVLPPQLWLALSLLSCGTITLNSYWLPDMVPPTESSNDSLESLANKFKTRARSDMLKVLNDYSNQEIIDVPHSEQSNYVKMKKDLNMQFGLIKANKEKSKQD